nr:mitochondrial import receptor subunit TOM20 homolog [Odocoileus virginianus texanus]
MFRLSASLAAGVGAEPRTRIRGFAVNGLFAGPAAADPALRWRDDGGPEQRHRRRRRKKQKLAKERAGLSKLPDLKDAEAVQKFFLEEIQLGEELLAQGEYEKGVDHLTNAIAVCGQPQQLLQVLQQTLPPPVFQMLLTKLPTISQRIVSAQSLAEDDVE